MGYSERAAKEALNNAKGDLELAVKVQHAFPNCSMKASDRCKDVRSTFSNHLCFIGTATIASVH